MTREEAKTQALALMADRDRPVLIGEVALACGPLWGIEDAARLLDELVSERLVEKVPGALERYRRLEGRAVACEEYEIELEGLV